MPEDDTQTPGLPDDTDLHTTLLQIEPLTEVTFELEGMWDDDDPDVEAFTGVVTTVNVGKFEQKDSIKIEGHSNELPYQYERFTVNMWYNVDDNACDMRRADAYTYTDSGDRNTSPLGKLSGITVIQQLSRDEVYDD